MFPMHDIADAIVAMILVFILIIGILALIIIFLTCPLIVGYVVLGLFSAATLIAGTMFFCGALS